MSGIGQTSEFVLGLIAARLAPWDAGFMIDAEVHSSIIDREFHGKGRESMPAPSKSDDERLEYLAWELVAGNLSIFVGSGLSVGAGLPSWRDLVSPMAKELDIGISDTSDLLAIAQYHVNKADGNRSRLNTIIQTQMGRSLPTTPALQAIVRLDVRTVWTTNYDNLIETALTEAGKRPQVIWNEEQLNARNQGANVMVYKMHGDAESPETAVLTKSDYERYHLKHQHFSSLLGVELSQKTFLYVGFGFRDHNVDEVFGRLRTLFRENQRRHYCVMKRPDRAPDESDESHAEKLRFHDYFVRDLSRRGVDVIHIESHDELPQFLARLHARSISVGLRPGTEKVLDAIAREIPADNGAPAGSAMGTSSDEALGTALLAPIDGVVFLNEPQPDMTDTLPLAVAGQKIEIGEPLFFLISPFSRTKVVSPIRGEVTRVVVANYTEIKKTQTLCLVRDKRAPEDAALYVQHSELEGRFFRAPTPAAEPYVRIGHHVRRGEVMGLVEIAKTFHDISADVNGIVRMINIDNDSDVFKGTYLFGIETTRQEIRIANERFSSLPSHVQRSPAKGRFFSLKADGRPSPLKIKGEITVAGEPVARVKILGGELVVLAEGDGRFLEYLKRDGDAVDLGEPIFRFIPEAATRATRRSFLVQTADRAGVFKSSTRLHAAVQKGQEIGTIGHSKIVCKHNGMVSEITALRNVKPNDILFKFAH